MLRDLRLEPDICPRAREQVGGSGDGLLLAEQAIPRRSRPIEALGPSGAMAAPGTPICFSRICSTPYDATLAVAIVSSKTSEDVGMSECEPTISSDAP